MTDKALERIRRACIHRAPQRLWDRGTWSDIWLCGDCGEELVLGTTAKDSQLTATAQDDFQQSIKKENSNANLR